MNNNIKIEKFKTRLNELIKENNITPEKLGEKLSFSKSTIYRYINGEMLPKITTVKFMAQLFNVNPMWLMGHDVKKYLKNNNTKNNTIKIPIVKTIITTESMLAEQNIIDYEELPKEEFVDGEYFGLKIKDNSMFPRILENDVVIVKIQNKCETGQIAVVLVNNETTIKKVQKEKNGITLISFNPMYPKIFFSNADIKNKPVQIIGIIKRLIGYNFE